MNLDFLQERRMLDGFPEPILLLSANKIIYSNEAARRVLELRGEAEELCPAEELTELPPECATSICLQGQDYQVTSFPMKEGQMLLLRKERIEGILPDERLELLAGKMRGTMNRVVSAVQMLGPEVQHQSKNDLYLSVLHQNCYRIMRMTEHLETVQRMSHGGYDRGAMQVLDLAGLCRKIERQVRPLAEASGFCFILEDEAGSLLVRGDGELLFRMVLNLISNAGRAAREKGGRVTLRLRRRGGQAVLTVSDNGGGMTSAALSTAFDPSAGQDSMTEIRNGLGLGLAICQYTARHHGGRLVLENREGDGVTAVFSIPAAADRGERGAEPVHFDGTGGFSTVLVELSDILPSRVYNDLDEE